MHAEHGWHRFTDTDSIEPTNQLLHDGRCNQLLDTHIDPLHVMPTLVLSPTGSTLPPWDIPPHTVGLRFIIIIIIMVY